QALLVPRWGHPDGGVVCVGSAGGARKFFARQVPDRLLAQRKLGSCLPHRGTIAQERCWAQAAITASDRGSLQREISPANPRVTMSTPSRCTPITADLCAGSVQSLAPLAASQKRSTPSASPPITMPSAVRIASAR